MWMWRERRVIQETRNHNTKKKRMKTWMRHAWSPDSILIKVINQNASFLYLCISGEKCTLHMLFQRNFTSWNIIKLNIFGTIEFHALGAVKERENVRKLHWEKGIAKCPRALVISGLFILNKLEMRDGKLSIRDANNMTMFCWITMLVPSKAYISQQVHWMGTEKTCYR